MENRKFTNEEKEKNEKKTKKIIHIWEDPLVYFGVQEKTMSSGLEAEKHIQVQ